MQKKFTSTVLGASLLITSVGIVSKGLGFVREMIYATKFGLELEFNIFLVGAALPVIINSTILFLGQNFFIPSYNEILKNKSKDINIYFSECFWSFLFFGFLIAGALYLFSESIIDLYITENDPLIKNTALKVFRIYLLTLPINSSLSILIAFFHSRFLFKYPAFSQIFMNISIITLLLTLTDYLDILVIPVAFALGYLLQITFLIFLSLKELRIGLDILKESFKFGHILNSRILQIVFIEFSTLSYVLIDRYFFHQVDEGGIAALSYANSIYILPIAIFSAALSTAILPRFSETFRFNDKYRLEAELKKAARISLIFFFSVSALFMIAGEQIIALLFERGRFSAEGSALTFGVLRIYAIGLVFYSTYAIINKLMYGSALLKQLTLISIAALTSKIVLNLTLVNIMKQEGLALATVISYAILFVLGYILSARKLGFRKDRYMLKTFISNAVNFGISGGLAYYITIELFPGLLFKEIIMFLIFFVLFIFSIFAIKGEDITIINELIGNLKSRLRAVND